MRKTRSDCRVGTFEKKHGLPPGTIETKMEEIPEVTKNWHHSQRSKVGT